MSVTEIKQKISECIKHFHHGDLKTSVEALLNTLGYTSSKKADIDLESLKKRAAERNIDSLSYALWDDWKSAELIFQITDEEIKNQASLFDFKVLSEDLMQSYLFFAVELKSATYNRGQLSGITRFMNRLYDMPVMVIFMYNHLITFAIINRRPGIRDTQKPVLEKITLIKDISIDSPHRAHIEILFDLSVNELQRKYGFTDFDGIHKAWQKTLDTKELNKLFYQKLFNWYLWALQQVKFPQMRPAGEMIPDNIHQSESLIRVLTRLLFVWFMKEKGLINPDLFDQNKLKSILKNFKGEKGDDTIYYKAILQNLFFATLNRKTEDRKPIIKGKYPNPEYGDPLVYRYETLFADPKNLLSYFEKIPFLNGGLFDCLDQRKDADNPVEIRLDGFSTKKEKQPVMPDKLFFGEYNNIDLSTDYDDKKKNCQTVFGIIDILNQYKFTIEENTPVEEEVALDPELLGKVFENLLASYNPETQTTARKQTGSFYTPREIVNYMVDESLIAYLKNHIDDETRLRKLFSYEDCNSENPFNKGETDILLKAIDNCKILDPACGSGAFPMGVLQKMIHILHKLDPDNEKWFEMVISNFPAYMQPEVRKKLEKENWNYVRKLGIIQQCLYGVDIQPIATQIAKLRFFISLLVDQREKPGEDNRGFEPLPNLDFKIVTANTLIPAPASDEETTGLFAGQTDQFFEEFDRLTGLYFSTSDPEDKKELKDQITRIIKAKCDQKIKEIESKFEHADEKASKALKEKHKRFIEEKEQEVKLWKSYPNLFKYGSVGFFEPKYFFPKAKDGFDVVIGNPPYGIEFSSEIKEFLKIRFEYLIQRIRNSFLYFMGAGDMLLKKGGSFSYIIPNEFLFQIYMEKARRYFLTKDVFKIAVNTGEDVFEAIVPSSIFLISKSKSKNYNVLVKDLRNRKLEDINKELATTEFSTIPVSQILNSPNAIFTFDKTRTSLLTSILQKSVPFDNYCDDIANGISTSCDNVYIIKNDLAIIRNFEKKYLRPSIRGSHFNKFYCPSKSDEIVLYITPEFNRKEAPNIYRYLEENKDILIQKSVEKKTGIREWHLLFRHRNEDLFISPKIVIRQTGDRIIASIDNNNFYCIDSVNVAKVKKEFLKKINFFVALLNSNLSRFIYQEISQESGRVLAQVKPQRIKQMPIIESPFQNIFDNCGKIIGFLKSKLNDPSFFENLLDAMVYELYLKEKIEAANCEVLQYLIHLPELKEEWSDKKKLEVIDKVYREFSDPSHPVSIAMAKMQEIEEVKIIEGRV